MWLNSRPSLCISPAIDWAPVQFILEMNPKDAGYLFYYYFSNLLNFQGMAHQSYTDAGEYLQTRLGEKLPFTASVQNSRGQHH